MRLLMMAAVLPFVALAQLDRSGLTGTVTDPAGARVPAPRDAIDNDTSVQKSPRIVMLVMKT